MQDSSFVQEQSTIQTQLDEFHQLYNEAGWAWPTVAGPSSENGLSGLRRELRTVQDDARGRFGGSSQSGASVQSEPASYMTRWRSSERWWNQTRCSVRCLVSRLV